MYHVLRWVEIFFCGAAALFWYMTTARERGEKSGEIGCDRAWMYTLRKEISATPLAISAMESLRPLGALGVDLDKLEYVLGDTRAELHQKLTLLSI